MLLNREDYIAIATAPYLVHCSPRENRQSIEKQGLIATVGDTYRTIYQGRHSEMEILKPCVFLALPGKRIYRPCYRLDRWHIFPLLLDFKLFERDLESVGYEKTTGWFCYFGDISPELLSRH